MSVYFVYRSHYSLPSLNYVKKFEDATVFDWFRRQWRSMARVRSWSEQILGVDVQSFESLVNRVAVHGLPEPTTIGRLHACLEEHLPVEGELLFQPHAIQALTDDDDLQLAYYFFDDMFLARAAGKAAFLLQEWKLPEEIAPAAAPFKLRSANVLEPSGQGQGAVYCAFLVCPDSGKLFEPDGLYRIDGIRLPELPQYLVPGAARDRWPGELLLLRSQLRIDSEGASAPEKPFLEAIQRRPTDAGVWGAYSDWLEENGRPRGGVFLERALTAVELPLGYIRLGPESEPVGARNRVQAAEHVAQITMYTASGRWFPRNLYHRWIFFDDLWASTYPDLAKALQTYGRRWDVLS